MEWNAKYGDGINKTVTDAWKAATDALKTYGTQANAIKMSAAVEILLHPRKIVLRPFGTTSRIFQLREVAPREAHLDAPVTRISVISKVTKPPRFSYNRRISGKRNDSIS